MVGDGDPLLEIAGISTSWLLGGVAATALLVIWSGTRLTQYGDALGERFNLSRTWVGLILLATVTSLPELVVTLSAQLAVARPRVAMGNVCGSNLINLCIFALLDAFEGPGALSLRLHWGLLKSARMGLICMGAALAALLLPVLVGRGAWVAAAGWGLSGGLLVVCLYSMWRTERQDEPGAATAIAQPKARGGNVVARFAAFAAVLVVGGLGLIYLCDALVDHEFRIGQRCFKLSESVVGTIGLAFVTSLPELVVCVMALRLGAFNMAVGDLLGSNVFNVMLLPLAHFVRPTRLFWTEALPVHWLALCAAMGLTVIIIAGIRRRSKWAFLRLGWDGALVAVLGGGALLAVAVLGQMR